MSHKTGFYEGRLGIGLASDGGDGTGNPRFPLDVNGDIRLTGAILKANGEKYLGGLTKIGFDNMTELQNGNIGVGTETPTVLFDISGNTKIGGHLQLNGMLKDASGNARIFSNWTVHSNGNDLYRPSGNVGIGTTSPGAKLEIKSNHSQLKLTDSDDNKYAHFSYSSNMLAIRINSLDSEDFTIKEGGNVGIGTTDPQSLLHIETNSSNAGTTEGDNVGSHNEIEALRISSLGDSGDVNSISGKISLISDTNSNIVPYGKLLFYLNNGASASNNWGYNPDNMVMSLVGSGNVGIGTTSPQTMLDIRGEGGGQAGGNCLTLRNGNSADSFNASQILLSYSGYPYNSSGYSHKIQSRHQAGTAHNQNAIDFYLWKNGQGAGDIGNTHGMSITAGGVGIGTTSPRCPLNTNKLVTSSDNTIPNYVGDIDGNKTCDLFLGKSKSSTNNYWGIWMGTVWNSSWGYPSYIQAGTTSAHYPLLLNPNGGNVGIGTTSPGYKLEVNGSVKFANCIWTQNNGDYGSVILTGEKDNNYWGIQLGDSSDAPKIMSQGTNIGFYFDGPNEWGMYCDVNGSTWLYHNGTWKAKTLSDGFEVNGRIKFSSMYHSSGNWRIDSNQVYMDGNSSAHFNWSGGGNTFVGNDQAIVIGHSNRLVITSSGNVGIGTAGPGEKLSIYHGSISLSGDATNHEKNKYGMIQIWGTGTGRIPARGIAWCSSVSVQSKYNGTTGLQYDGGATMGAWGTSFRRAGIFSEGGGYASHSGNLIFEVSNHRGRYEWGGINFEAMRIEKDGNITYSGTIGSASDNRIKHNEVPIKNALSTICKLNPLHYIKTTDTTIYDVSHNFILDSSGNPIDNSGNPVYSYAMETGIIAQDIKNIPELKFVVTGEEYKEEEKEIYKKDNSGNDLLDVSGNKIIEKIIKEIKPNILTVDYNSIHCTHIVATQELNNKVERENQKLKNEVATLKAELAAIKAHLGI